MEEKQAYTLKEYILYKLDRTIAIMGLILIGIVVIFKSTVSPEASKIINAVLPLLGFYAGVRSK